MYDNELIKEPEGSKYKVKRYYSKFGVYTFERKEIFSLNYLKNYLKKIKNQRKNSGRTRTNVIKTIKIFFRLKL